MAVPSIESATVDQHANQSHTINHCTKHHRRIAIQQTDVFGVSCHAQYLFHALLLAAASIYVCALAFSPHQDTCGSNSQGNYFFSRYVSKNSKLKQGQSYLPDMAHQCHLCAINCVAGQILYRSNSRCEFAIKGKMEMKDGRKDRRMGVEDRGNDVAMEVERQRLLEGNDKAD